MAGGGGGGGAAAGAGAAGDMLPGRQTGGWLCGGVNSGAGTRLAALAAGDATDAGVPGLLRWRGDGEGTGRGEGAAVPARECGDGPGVGSRGQTAGEPSRGELRGSEVVGELELGFGLDMAPGTPGRGWLCGYGGGGPCIRFGIIIIRMLGCMAPPGT